MFRDYIRFQSWQLPDFGNHGNVFWRARWDSNLSRYPGVSGAGARRRNPEPLGGEGPVASSTLRLSGGPGRIRTYNQQIMSLLL